MAYPPHVSGKRPASPAFPSEQEFHLRRLLRRFNKELFHPALPIGETIAHEREIVFYRCILYDGVMGHRIEAVVNGKAVLCSKLPVVIYDRRSTTVGEDEVIIRNQRPEVISGIGFHGPKSPAHPHPRRLRACVQSRNGGLPFPAGRRRSQRHYV